MNSPPDLIAQFEARMQEQNHMMRQLQQQMQQMMNARNSSPPRAHSIRDVLAPHKSYQSDTAIVLPQCNKGGKDAILKLVPLIEGKAYQGMTSENPLDHIREFEENCSMIDFHEEYVRMFLFPRSLAGSSRSWFKGLPTNSLKTWEECRSAFLDHFYTQGRTESFRNMIINYSQGIGESFYETWNRFKEYKIDCPHHGFSEEQLLMYFYNGVDRHYKGMLNVASTGDFTTQSIEGAYRLIENIARSSHNKDIEYDRAVFSIEGTTEGNPIGRVRRDMSINTNQKLEQRKVFDHNYRNHPNLSYRNPNVANPEDQFYPPIQNAIRPDQGHSDRTVLLRADPKASYQGLEDMSTLRSNVEEGLKKLTDTLAGLGTQVATSQSVTNSRIDSLLDRLVTLEKGKAKVVENLPEDDAFAIRSSIRAEPIPPPQSERVYVSKAPYPDPPRKSQKDLEDTIQKLTKTAETFTIQKDKRQDVDVLPTRSSLDQLQRPRIPTIYLDDPPKPALHPEQQVSKLLIGKIDENGTKNGMVDHLSRMRIENKVSVNDSLVQKSVYEIGTGTASDCLAVQEPRKPSIPWFADFANYLAAEQEPEDFHGYRKKEIS